MAPKPDDIVLFYWGMSPWASKVTTYLALRNLPHNECDQPITIPRPDIKALGINYRRIPVLAIGRDIYCDTLIILEKLEQLFPPGTDDEGLSAKDGTGIALEELLEKWTDVVVFKPAADAIPTSVPLLQDPDFVKDRKELWGRDWSPSEQDRLRPAGLSNLRTNFEFLESVLMDGRDWLGGNKNGPKMADLHAAWIFSWMLSLPDGLPEQFFSAKQFPRTRAWLDRYNEAVNSAKEKNASVTKSLESSKALTKILSSGFIQPEVDVEDDPQGFAKGEQVEVYPVDTGSNHRDAGRLVGLNGQEVVIEKQAHSRESVRIHFPRWNFMVEKKGKDGEKQDMLGEDPFGLRPTMYRMKSSGEFGHHDI